MSKTMWMVRAATGGRLADEFKEKEVVAIGWNDIENLSQYKDKAQILNAIKGKWPDWSDGTCQSSASQLIRFRDQLKINDRVITYDSSRRVYLVGTITGGYKHKPGVVSQFENIYPVKWDGEIERDTLSASTRNRLGSTLTLFLVPDFAADEIEAALRGKPIEKRDEAEDVAQDALIEDVREQSREHIKDRKTRGKPGSENNIYYY